MEEKVINDELEQEHTVFTYDDEDRFYRDIKNQIKERKRRMYIYNKKIYERIKEEYPHLRYEERDFYWEVINDETR